MQRLTGYCAATCPREALYRPEVQRACEWKHSKLSPLLEPDPSRAIVQAVAAVRRGESEWLDHLHKNPRRAAQADLPGPITSPDQLPRRRAR